MRLRLFTCFIIVCLLSVSPHMDATVVVKRSFSEMINLADLIFEGTVVAIESRRFNGWIRTFVTFADLHVLKGEVTGPRFVLQLSGGKLDGIEERISGVPEFEIGQREILFCKDNGRAVSPVI